MTVNEIEQARRILLSGQTQKTLEYLLSKTDSSNLLYDKALGLLTRIKSLESNSLEGVLRDDEYRSQHNKIQKALISLIREIEVSNIENKKAIGYQIKKSNNKPITLSSIWMYVVIALILIGLNFSTFYNSKDEGGMITIPNSSSQSQMGSNENLSAIDSNEIDIHSTDVVINEYYDDSIKTFNYGEGLSENNINCIRNYLKERRYDEVLDFLYVIEAENQYEDKKYLNRFIIAARVAKKHQLDDVYPSFPSKYILCKKNDLFGLVDKKENFILEVKYSNIDPLFSDYLLLQQSNLYGFLFLDNSKLIEPQFDEFYPDFDPLILVRKDSLNGLLNKSGDIVQETKYDVIWPPFDGMLKAKLNDKWGYIDTSGIVRIPFIYDYADHFEDGKAYVVDNDKRLIISKNNKVVRVINN